jgi:hypothetical protein
MAKQQKLQIGPGLRRFDDWLRDIGRSPATGYRWRKRGWIKVVNIGGRCYITDAEIERFIARSQQGEFFRRTLESRTTAEIKCEIKASFSKGKAPKQSNRSPATL